MAERKRKARRPAAPKPTLRRTPDAIGVAFQVGSFIRDAEWAIISSRRAANKEAMLLQALLSLQDAGRWAEEMFRLIPKNAGKRSALLAARRAGES